MARILFKPSDNTVDGDPHALAPHVDPRRTRRADFVHNGAHQPTHRTMPLVRRPTVRAPPAVPQSVRDPGQRRFHGDKDGNVVRRVPKLPFHGPIHVTEPLPPAAPANHPGWVKPRCETELTSADRPPRSVSA